MNSVQKNKEKKNSDKWSVDVDLHIPTRYVICILSILTYTYIINVDLLTRLEKLQRSGLENGVSRHHVGPIEGSPETPLTPRH